MSDHTADESSHAIRKLRRSHRKSRNGCRNCKRRKVKCDETKPECANCVRFDLPCDFVGFRDSRNSTSPSDSHQTAPQDVAIPTRRGRGRPRKDWTKDVNLTDRESVAQSISPKQNNDAADDPFTLNTANIELLLHFTSLTASTLSGTTSREDSITKFWAFNAPQIGLSHHFVLHLLFAVTSYHLANSKDITNDQRARYVLQAEHYFQIGLPTFTEVLANANESNCGALDIAATLVTYCTFAAGPKGPNDLLICGVDDSAAHKWLPMIKGLRLIREMFDPATLFSGLMSPLGAKVSPPTPDTRAECVRLGFPRIEWEVAIHDLGSLVRSSHSQQRDICLREFDILAPIYEATYGDANSEYHGPGHNRMVFGWLYRMSDEFVDCVRLKEPIALLLLAYFAPLLKTMKICWFMDGWVEHLLNRISEMLRGSHGKWIRWPRIQAGLPP